MSKAAGARRQGPDSGTISVFVADEQSDQPIEVDRWAALAERVLDDEGVTGEAELSILFVDQAHIGELNQRFMGHTGPTDVLSFPIDAADLGTDRSVGPTSSDAVIEIVKDVAASGTGPFDRHLVDPDDQPLLLGDVVICPAVAAAQAEGHAGTYDDEIALLIVHGVLHVLGMDHATDDQRIAMQDRERRLLDAFHGPLARDPWAS
jgi:probable rRNA maturation factor